MNSAVQDRYFQSALGPTLCTHYRMGDQPCACAHTTEVRVVTFGPADSCVAEKQ